MVHCRLCGITPSTRGCKTCLACFLGSEQQCLQFSMSGQYAMHACIHSLKEHCSLPPHRHLHAAAVLTALRHGHAFHRCALFNGHGTPISVSPDGSSNASVWAIAAEATNALVRTTATKPGWLY